VEKIEELAAADERVRGIRFRRKLRAKRRRAVGRFRSGSRRSGRNVGCRIYRTDPRVRLPRFLAEIDKGLDCISRLETGGRHDPWHKVGARRGCFTGSSGVLTGVKLHDHNCGFKCYTSAKFSARWRLYGELTTASFPVLAFCSRLEGWGNRR